MRSREEFGQYVLLKKLSEDPLGESFRAGRVGPQGLEQVVLLRIFNGRRIEPEKLWADVAQRGQTVLKALKSPHIAHGIDLGEVRNVPYVAYDYISGKNLENLLIQAANANSPIPADHALLIAERMALALSVAGDTRAGDERVVHGFPVPHLVMVSNEGETRVLGFEVAPGLAVQAGQLGPEISRYLAPELVASGRAERSDDVFTLGAVLFELLACQPLPAASSEGYGALIDGVRVAYDGSSLPPEIGSLLKKSLIPRSQRITDAGAWHKTLTQVLADGAYGATTFNLAFFMHNLFRQDIEEESREIEQEKKSVAAAPAAAAPTVAAAVPPPAAGAPGRASEEGEPAAARSKMPLIAAAAAVVLALAAGGGWYLFGGVRGGQEESAAAAQAALDPQPVTRPAPPEPQGPTPEEVQEQLAAMIETRSGEMAAQLREQYDKKIRDLQTQYQNAQREAAERETLAREQERLEAERRQRELEASAAEEEPPAEPASETAAQEPAPQPAQAAAADGGGAEADGAAERVAEAAVPAEQRPAPVPVKKEPEPPAVKVGDLVGVGEAGVVPPQLTRQPDVRYPPMARKLNRSADVEVRVLVDENGNVSSADLIGKKVGFGLDDAALDAARSAKYRPATKNGVRVKAYVHLLIRFDL
ncbi:MAG TPA: TonB family protein [Thermoanaerobaculia bacterium]|nr:TonB family protein [Thermoanaerobaculia bacterium]